MDDDVILPPLPKGRIGMYCTCFDRSNMEDFARAAVLADRERLRALCLCGEPWSTGIVHRTDGPCYWADPPTLPPDAARGRSAGGAA